MNKEALDYFKNKIPKLFSISSEDFEEAYHVLVYDDSKQDERAKNSQIGMRPSFKSPLPCRG